MLKIDRALLGFLLFLVSPALYSETFSEEYILLRQHLRVSAGTVIQSVQRVSLSNRPTIRLYVATDKDDKLERNIDEWIQEWNKKNAAKYRAIERARELSQSDLILSSCYPFDSDHSHLLVGGRRKILGANAGFEEAYAYILARRENELDILARCAAFRCAGPYDKPGKPLWDALLRIVRSDKGA